MPNFRLTCLTSLEAAAAGRSSPTIREMEWPSARVSSSIGICLGLSARSCLEFGREEVVFIPQRMPSGRRSPADSPVVLAEGVRSMVEKVVEVEAVHPCLPVSGRRRPELLVADVHSLLQAGRHRNGGPGGQLQKIFHRNIHVEPDVVLGHDRIHQSLLDPGPHVQPDLQGPLPESSAPAPGVVTPGPSPERFPACGAAPSSRIPS